MSVLVSLMKLNYVKIFVKCEKQGVKLTPLYSKLITKVSLKHFNYWGMMGVFFYHVLIEKNNFPYYELLFF